MFIKRKVYESLKRENSELKESNEGLARVAVSRLNEIFKLRSQISRRDPATGKFIKK